MNEERTGAKALLTVTDVAKMLNVPTSWVYQRTRKRGAARLPHVKLGKYLRFDSEAVLQWIAGQVEV